MSIRQIFVKIKFDVIELKMHSIQTKTTLLNIIAIFTAMLTATIISAVTIANFGHESVEEELRLSCETGKSNLNYYFKSVEQSIDTVSALIDDDLNKMDDTDFNTNFDAHINKVEALFKRCAENTHGVLTYYYRIDPEISDINSQLGFFKTNLDGKGFIDNPVTPIGDDRYECRWFYGPKESKSPIWLSPYYTDGLDNVYVISYNAPLYRGETFVGVAGIEVGYQAMGDQIKDIKVLKSGRAFIIDNENGKIIYHPSVDLMNMPEEERPDTPKEFSHGLAETDSHHIVYRYEGVEKHSYWLPLSNGMSIVVSVPLSEINGTWTSLIFEIVVAALIILAIFIVVTILYSRHFTKPLRELTLAAEEIDKGNYNVKLDYKDDDEIGVLAGTFNKLIEHLADYIADLNSLAYADALTSVRNKSAFDVVTRELQTRIQDEKDKPEFAIGIFDVDDLKSINDEFGHEKGDMYLKNACHLICRVFAHSVIFRIGGDEFAALLQGEDYYKRESLKKYFIKKSAEISAFAKEPWEQIRVAVGIAVYNASEDKTIEDVIRRADQLMYENKHERKNKKD